MPTTEIPDKVFNALSWHLHMSDQLLHFAAGVADQCILDGDFPAKTLVEHAARLIAIHNAVISSVYLEHPAKDTPTVLKHMLAGTDLDFRVCTPATERAFGNPDVKLDDPDMATFIRICYPGDGLAALARELSEG